MTDKKTDDQSVFLNIKMAVTYKLISSINKYHVYVFSDSIVSIH